MTEKQIIRIDGTDGSESQIDRETVERLVRRENSDPDAVMARLDAGERIQPTPFASYEIREAK